jgi:hypothetical protein
MENFILYSVLGCFCWLAIGYWAIIEKEKAVRSTPRLLISGALFIIPYGVGVIEAADHGIFYLSFLPFFAIPYFIDLIVNLL